ncbi:MAG: PP2C family protein-serine/threonine phosphatase [Planctomycetota bacterium]|nr:PP2C family protein-serine/threonine phosphatase [Planctomycetota bacterium]
MSTTPTDRTRATMTDWRERLQSIVETMREMSQHSDPQAMVRDYGKRMDAMYRRDGFLALSRRGLESPWYRITRSSRWTEEINPWQQKDRLPLLNEGFLGELLYAQTPTIVGDLRIPESDPGREYLEGMRSLVTLPVWDEGEVRNMTVLTRAEPNAFSPEDLPEMVWMAALFGRAAQNLVLRQDLQRAYDAVDRELQAVADIQRSLLPPHLPQIKTMDVAAHYQTARHAGGDYYDFFPLPDGRWGMLIADVSGHGVPAAVLMAITHSLAHTTCAGMGGPAKMLAYLNKQLHDLYTSENGLFVTAFCAAYDPESRSLTYASAGHNPPRVKRCSDGSVFSLSEARSYPLGILPDSAHDEATLTLTPGDQIIFYTDGVTEAMSPSREMFGVSRLDEVLENCSISARGLIDATLEALDRFTGHQPAEDDRTILVARIT